MSKFGGTPKCGRCGKSAYANESTKFAGKTYHNRKCFACLSCGKALMLTNAKAAKTDDGEDDCFCGTCFSKNSGVVGFRGGGAQGGVGNWNKDDTDKAKKGTASGKAKAVTGDVVCQCGQSQPKGTKFCSECGAKQT